MTEPDEALLWARESAYQRALEMLDGDETEALAQIDHEDAEYVINWLADTYRAGAAASAERIKELEAALGHFLGSYCDTAFWDVENEPEVIAARALLKEPDQ